jgi:hypothetical protein
MFKICSLIVEPIVVLIRTLVQIARTVVETVCELVSSIIKTVKTVVEKICKWLPWPLDKLCNLVTKIIDVFETVWNWVCHQVIKTIFDWIEKIIELIVYILRWVCIIIHVIINFPFTLLCLLDVHPKKFINVCVKILADEKGNPSVQVSDVLARIRATSRIYERCNLHINICSLEIISKPEFVSSTTCDAGGIFSDFFTWFSRNACSCCSSVTLYFVKDIKGASGCAYTGENWVTIANSGGAATIAQEIGHLALLMHRDDPENIMCSGNGKIGEKEVPCNPTRTGITDWQCCVISTSTFASFEKCEGSFKEQGE